MVEYAAASYCSHKQLDPWDCKACRGNTTGFKVTNFYTDPVTHTNGFVGYNTQTESIVLSFEGTADLQNWITDLQYAKLDFDYPGAIGCKVHKGFWTAYKAIGAMVERDITTLVQRFPAYKVFITGHSLGGALAVFAALDITVITPRVPVQVYTYGCPRIGNKAFSQYVHAKVNNCIRIVNYNDIVPHLPMRTQDFHHVSTEAWIQKNGIVKVCNGSGEDQSCSDGVLTRSIQAHLHAYHQVLGGAAC